MTHTVTCNIVGAHFLLPPNPRRERLRITNLGIVPLTVVLLERPGEPPIAAASYPTVGEVLDVGAHFEVVGPEAVRGVGAILQVARPVRCLCETTEAKA